MSVSADGLEIVSRPPRSERGQDVAAGLGGDVKTTTDCTRSFAPGEKDAWGILEYGSLKGRDSNAVVFV